MITKGNITLIEKSYTNDDIITLAEIKQYFYQMESSQAPNLKDNELLLYRDTAINLIETLLKTTIIKSDFKCELYGFHNFNDCYNSSLGFILSKNYIRSIEKIEYLKDNVLNILSSDIYFIEKKNFQWYINKINNKEFPEVDKYSSNQLKQNAVKITFKSGLYDYEKTAGVFPVDMNISTIKEAIIDFILLKGNNCNEEDGNKLLQNKISYLIIPNYSNWWEV